MRRSVAAAALLLVGTIGYMVFVGALTITSAAARALAVLVSAVVVDRMILPLISLMVGVGRAGTTLFELPVRAAVADGDEAPPGKKNKKPKKNKKG